MARHMCEVSQFERVISVTRKIRESQFVKVSGVNLRLSLEHSDAHIEDHLLSLQSESHDGLVGVTTLSSAIIPYAIGNWLDEENPTFGQCKVGYMPALTYSSDGHFRNRVNEEVDAADWTSAMVKITDGLEKSEKVFDDLANFVMDHIDYDGGQDPVIAQECVRTKRRVLRIEDGVMYESGISGTRSGECLLLQTYSQQRRTMPWKERGLRIDARNEPSYRPCSLNINFMQVLRDAQHIRSDRPMDLALTSIRRDYKKFLKLANIPEETARG